MQQRRPARIEDRTYGKVRTEKVVTCIAAAAVAGMIMGSTVMADQIKVWVPDNCTGFTEEQIELFKEANPDYADYEYVVEAVGEGDAVITEELTPENSDEDLMAALESFQEDCISYAK